MAWLFTPVRMVSATVICAAREDGRTYLAGVTGGRNRSRRRSPYPILQVTIDVAKRRRRRRHRASDGCP